MLSSASSNGDEHFVVNHHLTLLTQPVLAVRSRPKKIPPDLHQFERTTSTERKPNGISFVQSDSSDSGVDLCLSSSSSIQYTQPYSLLHRPLSALNEDSLTPDQNGFFSQPKRTKFVRMDSIEDLISPRKHEEKRRSSSFASEPTQLDHLIQRTNENHGLSPLYVTKRSPIVPLKTRKTIESSTASSSDEATPRSKLPNVQRQKPKAITPLGHYPNPEQIRAHINRSVIDTQHPPPYSLAKRRGILQQLIPFDASPSKVNNRYVRQHVENHHPTTFFHPDPNAHVAPFQHDVKRKKGSVPPVRDFVQMNKTKLHPPDRSSQREVQRTFRKAIDESDLSDEEHGRPKPKKTLFTNAPRRHQRATNEPLETKNLLRPTPNFTSRFNVDVTPVVPFYRNSRLPHLNDETKPSTTQIKQKTRTLDSNSSTETNRPTKLIEQLVRRPVNVPMKHRPRDENQFLSVAKVGPRANFHPNPPKRFFNGKPRENSPTSWSVISQHQSNQQRLDFHDSSCSSSYISFTFDSGRPSKQTLIDGRYVRPAESPKKSSFVDSPSQTSSRHTYPFTCTAEFDTLIENSLAGQQKLEKKDSTLDPQNLLSGILTVSMQADDLSTNYDSDDGWSNESAELLYKDERHFASKKRHRITSSQSTLKLVEEN